MPAIRKLSSELIAQIAAGEVVERPTSVVKELVENSIDAGASSVTVELREGGITYIRVADNGRGIPAEQIRLAFERHATSKLISAEQLYDIHTLGFRGEALASIAAVAKVTLTTRVENADFGTRAVVEGGVFRDIRNAASPVGTTIVVENLFQNVPVRLKFLKKPATEAALASDYMLRLILSRPDVAFRFVSQGKTIYRSVGDGSSESVLFSVYGRDTYQRLRKVHSCMNGTVVDGYVGVGELSRGNRQHQSFFVNGRCFRNAALSAALEKGCEGRVMVGKFPMCVLFLQVPYQQVDVNVHPNKLEVRFQNEAGVAEAIEHAAFDALHGDTLGESLSGAAVSVPDAKPDSGDTFQVVTLNEGDPQAQPEARTSPESRALPEAQAEQPQAEASVIHETPNITKSRHDENPTELHSSSNEWLAAAYSTRPAASVTSSVPTNIPSGRFAPTLKETALVRYDAMIEPQTQSVAPPPVREAEQLALDAAKPETEPRLIGVAFHTYWIFECGERLLLVDQHAAHERVLYDRMLRQFRDEHISQRLLSPQLIRLTARERVLAEECAEPLRETGFDIEPFDDSCICVRAIPTLFGKNESPRELLLEALDECQTGHGQVTGERLRRQVAQMACKRAIKGGDSLSPTEIEAFLKEMLQSQSMPTCPHGRPIVTEVTRYALEKRFKRV